jgi:opacity protein-like surface antigen
MERMQWIALAVCAALAVPAWAAPEDDREEPLEDQDRRREDRSSPFEVRGLVGVNSYVGDAADLATAGPAYGVGVALRVNRALGLEVSYQGATYDTDDDLPGGDYGLTENGGQALVRAGSPAGRVEPYAFGGIGFSRLDADTSLPTAVDDATLVKVPVGAGLDYRIADGTIDWEVGARGTYNFVVSDDDAFTGVDGRPDQLSVTFNLSARF